jgi:hypothetical protein
MAYSTVRKTDRIRMSQLVVYSTRMKVRQGAVTDSERAVGSRVMRTWKMMVARMKSPKKTSWTARPPMMVYLPMFSSDSVSALARRAPPGRRDG